MIPEFEKRGIAVPTPARQGRAADAQQYQEVYHQEESSGPSIATAGIGIILMIGSVVLSMNSGRIFYGAFLVGFVMFIKSFF